MELENRKVEGLITYSTEQQIFKVKVNSANKQELWGVSIEFTLYEVNCTIDAILQHKGYYHNRKCTKDTFKGSLFHCQENVSNTTLTIG